MNYLYNGVELTALPELSDEQKEKFRYVVIGTTLVYSVCFSANPAYYNTTKLSGCIDFETGTEMIQYNYYEGKWIYVVSNPTTWEKGSSLGKGLWTNTDILNEDGTLYLAASEPIPVATLDPASMLQGRLVGRAVAAQRRAT